MKQLRFLRLMIAMLVVLAPGRGLAQQAKTPQFAKTTIEPAQPDSRIFSTERRIKRLSRTVDRRC
jgi:hypothetical protein